MYVSADTSTKVSQAIHDSLSILFAGAPLSDLDWTRIISANDRVVYEGISSPQDYGIATNFRNLNLYAIAAKSPRSEMSKLLKGYMLEDRRGDKFTYDLIVSSALDKRIRYIPDAQIEIERDGTRHKNLYSTFKLPIRNSTDIKLSIPDGYGFIDIMVEQYGADPQGQLHSPVLPKVFRTLEKNISSPNAFDTEHTRVVAIRIPIHSSALSSSYQSYYSSTIADSIAPHTLYLNGELNNSPVTQSGQNGSPTYSNVNGIGSRNWEVTQNPTFTYTLYNLSNDQDIANTPTSAIFHFLGVIYTDAR